jgi:hypothetical protein
LVFAGPQVSSAQRAFSLVNNCPFEVWPATLSNTGMITLWQGGTSLLPGATFKFAAPTAWAGRIWARTGCVFNNAGDGLCATGDCGVGLYCTGASGVPPATLAEFTTDGFGALDFYDVSLVDGYNVPLVISPTGGTNAGGTCTASGCVADLNLSCPSVLQLIVNGAVVGCKSACEQFGTANYCCSGAYDSPLLCAPNNYSMIFKAACPTAYSYAYDDLSSTFTCAIPTGYTISFCPNGMR